MGSHLPEVPILLQLHSFIGGVTIISFLYVPFHHCSRLFDAERLIIISIVVILIASSPGKSHSPPPGIVNKFLKICFLVVQCIVANTIIGKAFKLKRLSWIQKTE